MQINFVQDFSFDCSAPAHNGIAVGRNAAANAENSIALGANSNSGSDIGNMATGKNATNFFGRQAAP